MAVRQREVCFDRINRIAQDFLSTSALQGAEEFRTIPLILSVSHAVLILFFREALKVASDPQRRTTDL
jgi:hypothetical protein